VAEVGARRADDDPVRLYFKEIGKVPLLTAAGEVQIGRRIEAGQVALRRALVTFRWPPERSPTSASARGAASCPPTP
jgi:hypothetical protein